jgi:adenylate kinase family enzyme
VRKVLLFGNSGAGKSTLARQLSQREGLAHLDLDTLAWQPGMPPRRRTLADSAHDVASFMAQNSSWVIEGCYSDLLELVAPECTEMLFLNPGIDACIANCRTRPWEPHKYASKAEQDANLELLVDWVRAYATRDDEFSLISHRRLFDTFPGEKLELGPALSGAESRHSLR